MNIGAISCAIFAVGFMICTVVFAILKEKGAILISGFNTIPKEERERYDQFKISMDMRNSFLIWTFLFSIGTILSYFISQTFSIGTFAIWLILFFKNVHLDTEKAFGKYKK